MIDVLLLRLDAPLMSFGTTAVDHHRRAQGFPARSMIAGLLANALGYDHGQSEAIQSLQGRLRIATRRDRQGSVTQDYQTVDLGQPFLVGTGWTTRGVLEGRDGAKSTAEGTHIRLREYHADSVYTVALTLDPGIPDLGAIEAALQTPARPLFLGRKCCIPSCPLLLKRVRCASLFVALELAPPIEPERRSEGPLAAWWPEGEEGCPPGRPLATAEDRDWQNQIHAGRRVVIQGHVVPREGEDA